MHQAMNLKLIKNIFKELFPHIDFRFIKIAGSQYQENGLPDLLILCNGYVDPNQSPLFQVRMPNHWFEIKRDWNDAPTALQKYNIKHLRHYNYVTGFVSGDEFKLNWTDKPMKLIAFLKNSF